MCILIVPVIVFITKGDGLSTKYFSKLRDEGLSLGQARKRAIELAREDFDNKIIPLLTSRDKPPTKIVLLKGMFYKFFKVNKYSIVTT
jgi:hypothetical protein